MVKNLFTGSLFLMTLISCAQQDFNKAVDNYLNFTVDTIGVKTLKKRIDSVYVIDARTPQEYRTSKIKNAVFINYDEPDYSKLTCSKLDTIVVYCTIGYRSEKIGEKLKSLGYKNVLNLHGGILSWANDSNAVYSPLGTNTNKIHTYDASWKKWLINKNYTPVN